MESEDQIIMCEGKLKDGHLTLSFADMFHPHTIEVKFNVAYVNEHPDSLGDIHSLISQLDDLIEGTLDGMLKNAGDKQ